MFCNRSLGSNDVIEHFPVGRRLAFDSEKGRLWVVCKKCERWNLSPLEERWEAVEMCEQLFRDTRVRVSTENVGLAKHPEGLELIRIGKPMRPEFAAWRYGDQFGRRRKRALAYTGGGLVLLAGFSFVGPLAGGAGMGGYFAWQAWESLSSIRSQVKLSPSEGKPIKLRKEHYPNIRLRASDDGHGFRLSVFKGRKQRWFEGREAERFASLIVPKMNHMGGKKNAVQSAVQEIEHHGHPDHFLEDLVRGDRFQSKKGVPGYINKMPTPTKLALEMALHEERERLAMEGELWRLEEDWKAAEEIAAISDNLLLPDHTDEFIETHRTPVATESTPDGDVES